jgi:hypothetical protein
VVYFSVPCLLKSLIMNACPVNCFCDSDLYWRAIKCYVRRAKAELAKMVNVPGNNPEVVEAIESIEETAGDFFCKCFIKL